MVKKPMPAESSSEEETYHVEVILKARVAHLPAKSTKTHKDEKAADWEYYIKWANYDSSHNSWEPHSNLAQCDRLLDSFWKHIGMDNDDYQVGYQVVPTDAWIAREQKFFAKTFGKDLAESSKKAEKDHKGKHEKEHKGAVGKAVKTKVKKRRPGYVWVTESEDESEEADDDKPLKATGKATAKRKASEAEHSDSSPEESLKKVSKKRKITDKGKGKAQDQVQVPPLPRAPSPRREDDGSDNAGSLFSAPSSPEQKMQRRLASSSTMRTASTSTAVSSAAGASVPPAPAPAPAPKPHVPSHKNKESKVKMMDMPTTGVQGISTKAKLGAPRLGSDPSVPAPIDPRQQQKAMKGKLAGLSFKKKSTLENSGQPAAGPSNAAATDPRRRPPPVVIPEHNTSVVDSPMSMHSDLPAASPGWSANSPAVDFSTPSWAEPSASNRGGPPRPRQASTAHPNRTESSASTFNAPPLPRGPPQAQRRTSQTTEALEMQASAFLASIAPPELTAPMYEPDGHEPLPVVPLPRPKPVAKAHPQFNIPKKWVWDGELHVESGPNEANKLCNIRMTDATAWRRDGLRIHICYNAATTVLRLQKMHNLFDINIILRACAPIQQYCKVYQQTEADTDSFESFSTYMARKRLFTYAHVELNDTPVGLLIIFPGVHKDLSSYLKVPPEVRDGKLIAMLVPWAITADDYVNGRWFKSRHELFMDGGQLDPEMAKRIEGHPALGSSSFALGLRIHGFNARVWDFLSRSPRDYCLWFENADGTSSHPGFETKALIATLDACKARNVGYKQDVRVIFVHVGALRSFYKLHALAMRRSKLSSLRFYLYGTHPTVPPTRWGIREVYPTGGYLTFSPGALLQNTSELYALLEKVYRHPLWMCYVHPYTIAAAAKLLGDSSDTSRVLDRALAVFPMFLQLIESGKVALLRAPPLGKAARQIHNGPSPAMDWVGWMMGFTALGRRELITECIRLLDEQFGALPDNKLGQAVEGHVVHDLWQLQLQPSVMDNYRRFVVIREMRNINEEEREGVELTCAANFSFKDDYFGR